MSEVQLSPTIVPVITLYSGHPAVTSLEVAKHFGKRHDHVVRDIKKLVDNCPKEFTAPNFGESDYTDSTGRKLFMYQVCRDGFMLLVMGYTGKEAMRMKLAYIEAFNRMEAELREQAQQALPPADPAIEDGKTPKQLFVPFHGTTLCMIEHEGEAYVQLKTLAEGMGIPWGAQTAEITLDKTRWCCEYLRHMYPGGRRVYKTLCMPLHMLQDYLYGMKAQLVEQGQEEHVKFYQAKCVQTLLAAWRTHKTGVEFLPSGKVSTVPLRGLLKAWGEVSEFTAAAMKAQVQATFTVSNIADLTADQMPQALAWVQNKIDEATARERKQLPPSTTPALAPAQQDAESAFMPPALQDDDESMQVDALIREYDNDQIQQHKGLHLRIMKLIQWRVVGMEWFDLASNVIFCMLSASRCERSGRAGEPALPVQFAQQLNKLLSRARWQEIDASRRPAA